MRKYPGVSRRPGSPYWQLNKTVKYDGRKVVIRESTGVTDYALAVQICKKREQEELERLIHGLRYPFTVDHAAAKLLQTAGRNKDDDVYHLDMLVEWMGDVELSRLHDEHPKLVAFKRHRLKTCKHNTVNRTLEKLRLMLNLAATQWRDNGLTWIVQAPRISLLPRKPGRHGDESKGQSDGYPIAEGLQRELFRQLPWHAYKVAWFIAMTGCREHEVVPEKIDGELVGGLRWQHELKLPDGWSVFDLPTSKNNRPKRIFLNSVAREIIEACRGDHPEFVFVWKGKAEKGIARPFTKLNNTAWKRARRQVGLENCRGPGQHFRVHDLRHTFASRLRESGVSREDRKDFLGHVNDDITTHYSTAETLHMIELVERLVTGQNKPSLYLVKNTHSTQLENADIDDVVSV